MQSGISCHLKMSLYNVLITISFQYAALHSTHLLNEQILFLICMLLKVKCPEVFGNSVYCLILKHKKHTLILIAENATKVTIFFYQCCQNYKVCGILVFLGDWHKWHLFWHCNRKHLCVYQIIFRTFLLIRSILAVTSKLKNKKKNFKYDSLNNGNKIRNTRCSYGLQ